MVDRRYLRGRFLRRVRSVLVEAAFRALRGQGGTIGDRFGFEVAKRLGQLRVGHGGLDLGLFDVEVNAEGRDFHFAVHLPGVADHVLRLRIANALSVLEGCVPTGFSGNPPEN